MNSLLVFITIIYSIGSQPMGRDPNWGREAHFIGSQASLKTIKM